MTPTPKTLATELQLLRELDGKRKDANPENMVRYGEDFINFHFAAPDMMRMIEHQAKLLDAARGGLTEIRAISSERDVLVVTNTALKLLDPSQPMSEE